METADRAKRRSLETVRHRTPPPPQQNNIRELGQKRKFMEESPSWRSVLMHLKTLMQSTQEIKVDSRLYPAPQGIYESLFFLGLLRWQRSRWVLVAILMTTSEEGSLSE